MFLEYYDDRVRIPTTLAYLPNIILLTLISTQGGSLAVRGGVKAARNSAIGCAILLAVIEGVGIGIQRMMAENTRLDVSLRLLFPITPHLNLEAYSSRPDLIICEQVPAPPPTSSASAEASRSPMIA